MDNFKLSCLISANQHEAETSENINKRWKTRAKGNDVITNVIWGLSDFTGVFVVKQLLF